MKEPKQKVSRNPRKERPIKAGSISNVNEIIVLFIKSHPLLYSPGTRFDFSDRKFSLIYDRMLHTLKTKKKNQAEIDSKTLHQIGSQRLRGIKKQKN